MPSPFCSTKGGWELPKKILVFLLALFMLSTVLCACDLQSLIDDLQLNTGEDDESVIGDGTSYSDFIEVMTGIKEYGDTVAGLDLPVQSEYYYSFAGASVSALRYATEYILWLKGEGDTLASFTSASRYTGWKTIAEINYASPYPSYFEGLLLEIQGKTDECIDPYASAAIMTLFPEEGLDFYYLKQMSVSGLYDLRDKLRALEDSIYAEYSPVLTGHDWDKYMFDKDYLVALSAKSVEAGEYAESLFYAKQALKADPFDTTVWHNAVMCAVYAEEIGLAGEYVDEGLAIFPDDSQLKDFRKMILDAWEDKGVEQ